MSAGHRGSSSQSGAALYLPEMATIVRARNLTDQDRLFEIELPGKRDLGHKPGQFVQVSLFGFGEAPISLCSAPAKRGSFELCVRKMGGLTGELHRLGPGDRIGIRGPLGNGFPTEAMQNTDCLVVAGGIGLAPLRSLINTILADRDSYGRLMLLYGARTPSDILFADELAAWQEDERNRILVTVDRGADGWEGHVGVVTTLFPMAGIERGDSVLVSVVGPPVMYRFVYAELRGLGVPDDRVYFSLERRMKCGVGKCGNCQLEHRSVCMDGPVFSGQEIGEFHEGI